MEVKLLKSSEDISSTKKRLKIEISAETIEAEIKKGLEDVQKKSKIPGFRPGKAPMTIIEKKFGRDVEADVLEKIVPEFYMKAVKEADVRPVSGPVMEESFDFKRNTPLSMTVVVDVMPKVGNLQYDGLTIKDIAVEADSDEIASVLNNLAEEKAAYETVDDAVKTGDLVTVDYTIKSIGEGAPGENIPEKSSHWDNEAKDVVLKVGSGPYPAEFFDGVTGRKKDEEFEIEAAFPDDMQSPFAGRKPKFQIKIKDIKRRNAVPVDDEFAKDMGFENLDILKDKVKNNIITVKNREAEKVKQREILDKLLEKHEFEAPESMLNAEVDSIVAEIKALGKDSRPDEEIKEEYKPNAEKSVKASILLELIGEKEGIKITDEDIKQEILDLAQRYYVSPEHIVKYYTARDGSIGGLKQTVFERKVLNFLLDKAKIEKGE